MPAKIITICGSLKFTDEIMRQTEKLELAGNCVLSIIYPTREDKDDYTEAQIQLFDKLHRQRIAMSDAIFVVNANGYIGNSTRNEIAYAKSLGKAILSLEPIE
jgi:hypothetical protein